MINHDHVMLVIISVGAEHHRNWTANIDVLTLVVRRSTWRSYQLQPCLETNGAGSLQTRVNREHRRECMRGVGKRKSAYHVTDRIFR